MLEALREADVEEAVGLLAGEGWTFTGRELGRLLTTGPGLSVAARERGAMLGLLTVARHGDLAWIGNVVVAAPQRGKGLGEALVREALRRCSEAGVRTVKLCSVHAAETLYARVGFRREGLVATLATVHERPTHRPVEAELLFPDDLPELLALDQPRFGADRGALLGQLLRDYPDTAAGVRDARGALQGFAFLKHGAQGSEVGPVVLARPDRALAAQLLDAVLGFRLQGGAAAVECTVPADHPFMRALLEERGFAFRDTKRLMAWGEPRAQDWGACAALGGLEKG